jgi:6-phosphogluconate dehydrogenase (decarboxylating)
METQGHEIGMIGLGVMGCNLLLNLADHGHAFWECPASRIVTFRCQVEALCQALSLWAGGFHYR